MIADCGLELYCCTKKFPTAKLIVHFGTTLVQYIGATSWENLFISYVNNSGTDQPAHPCCPISTFIVCCLDSIIPILARSKNARVFLVSVAEQADLSLIWSHTLKTFFLWRVSSISFMQWNAVNIHDDVLRLFYLFIFLIVYLLSEENLLQSFNFIVKIFWSSWYTVMFLSFRTDMPWQTISTQVRRLLEKSDRGLHCLLFHLLRLDALLLMVKPHCSNFRIKFTVLFGCSKNSDFYGNQKICWGQKKKICMFQVSWPNLGFFPDPKHFIVNCEQNIVKYAEKWGEM